jgi:uncharacterized protein
VRFILLVVLVVVAFWVVRRALRSFNRPEVQQKSPIQGELVSCARCGVHLPRAEAREAGGALFCSEEHARLGRSDSGSGRG